MNKNALMVCVDRWLNSPQISYSETTAASYRFALEKFSMWANSEDVILETLTPERLAAWLRSAGRSKNYRRLLGNAVRSFLRHTYGPGHPAIGIRLPKDDAPAGRSLSLEQFDQLVQSFDSETLLGCRNMAIVMLMMDTGLRSAEVCRLESRRVNLANRTIMVIAKGGEWREGAVTEETAQAMQTWSGLRRQVARRGTPEYFVSLLGSKPGTGLTPGGLRNLFRVWGAAAGLGPLSPHDLRRSMSILYYESGAPDKAVMDAGHWDDVRTLHRYQRGSRIKAAVRYSPTNGLGERSAWQKEQLKQKTPRKGGVEKH